MTREEFYERRRQYRMMMSSINFLDKEKAQGASMLHRLVWDATPHIIRNSKPYHKALIRNPVRMRALGSPLYRIRDCIHSNTLG